MGKRKRDKGIKFFKSADQDEFYFAFREGKYMIGVSESLEICIYWCELTKEQMLELADALLKEANRK